MFLDRAKIHVRAGEGGNGCASFRREKFIPHGGPDGGDGGHGGAVVLLADSRISTLNSFHHRQHFRGNKGSHGEGSTRHGKDGKPTVVPVPPGTVVVDDAGGGVLFDLARPGAEFVAVRGGRGGRGNARFATSTRQAPREAETGQEGEERWLRPELRLLADVGLVGFPNAGKSTLLSRLTAARPKVANYPFTTLSPHLGVLELGEFRTAVLADIPGLIRGAHEGAGLGDRFLQHLRRTRILVHLVDAASVADRSPLADYRAVRHELEAYGAGLEARPEIVILSRADRLEDEAATGELMDGLRETGGPAAFPVSSVTGQGLDRLRRAIAEMLEHTPPVPDPATSETDGEVVLNLRERRP